MTVGEALKILETLPPEEEIFVCDLDVDQEPMFMQVNAITDDPEGIIIRAGDQVWFEDQEEAEASS